ncbi:MAG TPA: hypothetical protein PKD15_00765 [Candidatus Saccharibacteria bacterium]|nr:hypothetical protein [Candidatus Saccharibacteria bacterium]
MLITSRTTTGIGATATDLGDGDVSWSAYDNTREDDSLSGTLTFTAGGQIGSTLYHKLYALNIPDIAVIDGITVAITGTNFSCQGDIELVIPSKTGDTYDAGTLNTTYGGSYDLWGFSSITPDDLNDNDFGVKVLLSDVSGGDGVATIDSIIVTVDWHYDLNTNTADVPTRLIYKVYDIYDSFLGLLDANKVVSDFNFIHNINSTGTKITVDYAEDIDVAGEHPGYILTEDGEYMTDEDDNRLVLESATPIMGLGTSDDPEVLIRNGNRIVVTQVDAYYPNGKDMFTGQIRRVSSTLSKDADSKIRFVAYSDGIDTNDYITRGAPFTYTIDQSQTTSNLLTTIYNNGDSVSWKKYGQTFIVGAGVTNIGSIKVKLRGKATVTLKLYKNGNFLSSVTRSIDTLGVSVVEEFAFSSLVTAVELEEYFFSLEVASGQSIRFEYHSSDPYADGEMMSATYAGGSGGGSWVSSNPRDMYFVVSYGNYTTTATYTTVDPITGMLSPILDDYNIRGGRLFFADNYEAAGLTISYQFKVATIKDALNKGLEFSPNGYYYSVDLGTNEITMKNQSATPDYTLIRGNHYTEAEFAQSIENMTNEFLFTGGDTGGGTNLFKRYYDTDSQNTYGVRLGARTDSRVTNGSTADAYGDSYIEENKDEQTQSSIYVRAGSMDITLLVPGKVIRCTGNGNFIDDMLFQIISRDYTPDGVRLSLGTRAPQLTSLVESLRRGLFAQETIDNPSTPS